NLDGESVDSQCEALARRGLFLRFAGTQDLPDGTIAQRYEFLHALYREVLYGRQAPARRAMLHRQLGDRLEATFASPLDDVAPELAPHFEHGSDWPRAVRHLRLTAMLAAKRYAPREATAALQHALELAAKIPEPTRGLAETEALETL